MTLSLARVLHSRSRSPIIYFSLAQDPRIDGNLLKLGPEDHLLMLTTGGCNVLDRLLDGVGHIVSVDLNPSQNALLELRLAAARACTHEQFFQLFAHSKRRLFDALYPQTLRPLLSPSAQRFWDDNAGNFFDDFFYAGASGGLARILCWLTWLFGLQPLVRALLHCRSIEEQASARRGHERAPRPCAARPSVRRTPMRPTPVPARRLTPLFERILADYPQYAIAPRRPSCVCHPPHPA